MEPVNPEFVERYQLLLEKKPESKVFAPLAEAYRKMGFIKQAIEVCTKGIQHNPHFSSGYIAFARIYMAQKDLDSALVNLQKACELSPENLLGHELLAECYLKQKKTKLALKAYKMVLFLNPQHQRAAKAIKKLESLTADEFDDETFLMEKLPLAAYKITHPISEPKHLDPDSLELEDTQPPETCETIDRFTSLVDAYIARNEIDKARETLIEAERILGPVAQIIQRKPYVLNNRTFERLEDPPAEVIKPLNDDELSSNESEKLQVLKNLLSHIEGKV